MLALRWRLLLVVVLLAGSAMYTYNNTGCLRYDSATRTTRTGLGWAGLGVRAAVTFAVAADALHSTCMRIASFATRQLCWTGPFLTQTPSQTATHPPRPSTRGPGPGRASWRLALFYFIFLLHFVRYWYSAGSDAKEANARDDDDAPISSLSLLVYL